MSDVLPPTERTAGDIPAGEAAAGRTPEREDELQPRRPALRLVGLLLIIASVLAGYYLVVVYLGWQSGQTLLIEKQEKPNGQVHELISSLDQTLS